MKVSFNFSTEVRSIKLEPTDELEKHLLDTMHTAAEKGAALELRWQNENEYFIDLKVKK